LKHFNNYLWFKKKKNSLLVSARLFYFYFYKFNIFV
jgi:hypothetical protein